MIKKEIIFLGPPGVGKGTLASIVSGKLGIIHISTGEIFRKEIREKTKLGKQVTNILNSGAYVPDELTNKIVMNSLTTKKVKKNGYILDGFPRTMEQAKFLEQHNIKPIAILFDAPEKIILKRLIGRKRIDDNPKIIKKRLKIYKEKTAPLIDFYKQQSRLITIDASGSIDENFDRLLKDLKK